jgi:hypothetical protein
VRWHPARSIPAAQKSAATSRYPTPRR